MAVLVAIVAREPCRMAQDARLGLSKMSGSILSECNKQRGECGLQNWIRKKDLPPSGRANLGRHCLKEIILALKECTRWTQSRRAALSARYKRSFGGQISIDFYDLSMPTKQESQQNTDSCPSGSLALEWKRKTK